MENKEVEELKEIEEIIQLLKNSDTANLGKDLLIKKGISLWSSFIVWEDLQECQHLELLKDEKNKFLTKFILNKSLDVYKYDSFYSIYVLRNWDVYE